MIEHDFWKKYVKDLLVFIAIALISVGIVNWLMEFARRN